MLRTRWIVVEDLLVDSSAVRAVVFPTRFVSSFRFVCCNHSAADHAQLMEEGKIASFRASCVEACSGGCQHRCQHGCRRVLLARGSWDPHRTLLRYLLYLSIEVF